MWFEFEICGINDDFFRADWLWLIKTANLLHFMAVLEQALSFWGCQRSFYTIGVGEVLNGSEMWVIVVRNFEIFEAGLILDFFGGSVLISQVWQEKWI